MRLDWIEQDRVAAMARPRAADLPSLREAGVTALISLTEGVPAGLPAEGITHLHLPVIDFRPPTQAQLDRACAFIGRAVDGGGRVAVHCGAGLGRTGTVVAAWLVHSGAAPDDAIGTVRRCRPGSVETREQAEAVRAYAARVAREAGR